SHSSPLCWSPHRSRDAPRLSSQSYARRRVLIRLINTHLTTDLMEVHIHELHEWVASTQFSFEPSLLALECRQIAPAECENAGNEPAVQPGIMTPFLSESRDEESVARRQASPHAKEYYRNERIRHLLRLSHMFRIGFTDGVGRLKNRRRDGFMGLAGAIVEVAIPKNIEFGSSKRSDCGLVDRVVVIANESRLPIH